MTQVLKQSTAVDVLIGPFVDKTDGATAETGESPSVKLSKNGQTLAAKNDATTPVHDADGYHNCELDATDTNTVGTMILTVAASANALPVRHEFQVIEEATYDFLYAASATPIADINAEVDTALTDIHLDHLMAAAAADVVVDGSVIAHMVSATEDWSTFVPSTDALQALRDRGDAAWTTGAGGSPPTTLQNTTIATLASQVSFTLTAGSADDGAYVGALAIIEDASTSTQKAVGVISAYTGSTKTVTLDADPGVFTMAATDTIDIVAITPALPAAVADAAGGLPISDAGGLDLDAILVDTNSLNDTKVPQTLNLTASGNIGVDWANVENPTTAVDLSATDIQLCDTVTTNTDLVSAADVWAAATRVLTANTNLNDPTAAAIADAIWDEAVAGHVGAGTFGATDAAILVDTNSLNDTKVPQTLNLTASGNIGIDWANVENPTTAVDLSATDIQLADTTTDVTNQVTADTTAISGDSTAADNLEASAETIVTGGAITGTLTTTTFTTNLTEATDDHYIGRIVLFRTGVLAGQGSDITDYTGATKLITVTAMTEAPSNGDTFVII